MKKQIRNFSFLALLIVGVSCNGSKTDQVVKNMCECFKDYSSLDQVENASKNQIAELRECVKETQTKNKELLKNLPRDEIQELQKELEKAVAESSCYEFLKEL